MQLQFSDDRQKAFSQTRLVHLFFAGNVLVFILAAELVMSSDVWGSDKGFADLGAAAWFVRVGIAFYGCFLLLLILTLNEKRVIARGMELQPGKPDLVVKRALEVTQILRSMNTVAPGVAGFCLFMLTGERLDLYVPAAACLLVFALGYPRSSHWDDVFAEASRQYPAISPSPWSNT